MSAVVLASGVLHKKPERKTSKSGNAFVAATLRVREADARYQYWSLRSFDTASQDELLRLDEGDSVSVQGLLRAEIYKPEGGEPRLSMTVIVDQALAAKPKPRPRDEAPRKFKPRSKAVPSFAKPTGSANLPDHIVDGLNDTLPW
jgi:single-stranded DNA-binding protein